jgi:hypothetical protein
MTSVIWFVNDKEHDRHDIVYALTKYINVNHIIRFQR